VPPTEAPGGDGTVVRLSFPPEAQLLGTVRLVVGMVARKAGVDEEGIEDLKVAVSETCAVAVTDLAWAGLDAPIELDLILEPDRFGIEVRDRAPAGEPTSRGATAEEADLDDRQFGLALVGALVDDLASEPLGDGEGHRTRFWLRHKTDGSLPPPLV
jgi:anti-sigma regulatory factor (Ser/Thr protein kinase)